ncbi:MAG TPA: mechanosensitive ion channel domain-containing protein [Aggregatilineales bacterium]|nr:mechanosensitive ion channel domain-containing protein [Aggregatilineales bacterium]
MTFEETLMNYIVPIAGAFLLAWIVQRISHRLVGRFIKVSEFAPQGIRLSEERQRSLHDLLASATGFAAFLLAFIFTIGLFVDTTTLIWMIGLFSAAFGLGARPLISDFLTGLGFIFEDTFDIGEKVEIMEIEGVIERINLRTTLLRAPTGELYIIPNGEIRVIRNFSRGRFSSSDITFKVAAVDLKRALELLESLTTEALELLPNMLEPWQVISQSGAIGEHAELSLVVKARFGKAAELRTRLLTLIQERMNEADIHLVS